MMLKTLYQQIFALFTTMIYLFKEFEQYFMAQDCFDFITILYSLHKQHHNPQIPWIFVFDMFI